MLSVGRGWVSIPFVATDFELLDAWREGDRSAGNELFERYFDSVYSFFRNKVGQAAEDLVQQTFLACTRSKDGLRKEASFRTYLFTAARSKLYNHLEKSQRDPKIDVGVTSCADLGISPSAVIAHSEDQELLLHALRLLPLQLQVALELFYFEQIRGPELAQILDVPEGTVRSRLRRGRELLREQLTRLAKSSAQLESTLTGLEEWAAALREGALAQAQRP